MRIDVPLLRDERSEWRKLKRKGWECFKFGDQWMYRRPDGLTASHSTGTFQCRAQAIRGALRDYQDLVIWKEDR